MDSKQKPEDPEMDRHKRPENTPEEGRQPKYHVYVRLPFNRGDFVDPGTVNWDERKSEALWGILSGSSIADVDWARLAAEFDVSVDFLLQMANYLTERHTSQLRAQMLRAAAARGSNAPSPVPGAEPPGGYQAAFEATRRITSGAGRAPSALSIRRDTATPLSRNEGEYDDTGAAGPSTLSSLPTRPRTSRTSSTGTAVPNQTHSSTRPGTATRLSDPQRHRLSYLHTASGQQQQRQPPQQQEDDTEYPPSSPAASAFSSPSSSSSSDSPVESRIIRRPPRFQSKNALGADEDEDDDDDEPAFLPFKPQGGNGSSQGPGSSGQDLGATLRGGMRGLSGGGNRGGDANLSQTSDSSLGSSAAAIVPRRPGTAGRGAGPAAIGTGDRRLQTARGGGGQQGGPLSPRRTAELAGRGLGSGGKGKGASREGSDGTPSMGSSFSDLDDASVTQSALEEALASRMQDGTIGSRMSVIGGTIGQAIRSRYLPKSNG